ncbi:TPA: restriction endonuclease subunit S [Clostridium perfringens]|uniref:Restriction endonuclease subunit S n=1 Tax=Clostridium perfringens TaxID=1502 RepID=A0A8H9UWX7_CLOPF|nr:restriction endonuclease subunit S [Clostridium perfringens]
MKSNYKRIGDYIREVKVKNRDLNINTLMGINIDKYFMPSVANTVGTDMSKYKIVKKGQFACNRMHVGRDKRLPISLLKDYESIIVSPAYTVFEIIDENQLDPEYLMMWFSREEFDRQAWFYTDSDVRGGLGIEDLFNIKIPVPSIEKQREIVNEYNTVLNRIKLNENMICELENLSETIYKQWFVDFNFPDENGKPYKSSGGEIYFNEILGKEVPLGWNTWRMNEFGNVITGKTPSSDNPEQFGEEIPFVTPGDFKNYNKFVLGADRGLSQSGINKLKSKILKDGSVVVTCIGSDMGKVVLVKDECITNQQMNSIVVNRGYYSDYLYYYIKSISQELKSIALGGSTMPMLSKSEFESIEILKPMDYVLEKFSQTLCSFNKEIIIKSKMSKELDEMRNILLSRITLVEE